MLPDPFFILFILRSISLKLKKEFIYFWRTYGFIFNITIAIAILFFIIIFIIAK